MSNDDFDAYAEHDKLQFVLSDRRRKEPLTMAEAPTNTPETTPLNAFEQRIPRKTLLQGAVAASAAAASLELLSRTGHAQTPESATTIFSIAATAEQLAVTFYTNGVNNATALGLTGATLDAFKAFLIEEQIHLNFFVANGGKPLTGTFSFPKGAATFTSLANFIATQQQLEGAFDSAFIAAAYEFAQMGMPDLTRIACQIAMIEEGHRTVGRYVGGLDPAEELAFAPQLVATVGDAPAVLTAAGYLSPVAGNTYTYAAADFTSAALAPVYANINNKMPTHV